MLRAMKRSSSLFARGSSSLSFAALLLSVGCTDASTESRVATTQQAEGAYDWVNDRVAALIAQMTPEEKISQLQNSAPAIERLNLPAYEYWSEGLHGVLTNAATSYPSPIALSSSWDPALVQRVASAISDEARGISVRDGKGLTYWSPVINMLRDPRWGRYDESYSEDPLLMSRFGVAFVRGLQGDDPKYLKVVATPKHFALNNSEYNRHDGNSEADARLLFEYYLPAFEATVTEAKAFSVMAAYNRVNGVPASANRWLLDETLRKKWGFEGYVVSDCDAVYDIAVNHHWTSTIAEAAAKAIVAGTDLNCGNSYPTALGTALSQGLMVEADLDRALTRVLRARFLLGEFDAPEAVPYRAISTDVIESAEHRALALEAAKASIVLLKNEGEILPLDSSRLKSIAVIGPHGDSVELGSYSGNPTHRVSALTALKERFAAAPDVTVAYAQGTTITGEVDAVAMDAAVKLARSSDVAFVFAGTDLNVFREEKDRPDWVLPGAQQELISAVYAANPRTVLVLVTGGPLGVDWAQANVPAILTTFYNGQEQGYAIADVLFGDYNPSGKLTTTWYRGDATLPPIGDYDLRKGRTYLYHQEVPLYPFGFGLSYTQYSYAGVTVTPSTINADESANVTVQVTNRGARSGDEIIQLYVRAVDSKVERPLQQLRGFTRLHLDAAETKEATFTITPKDLSYYDETTDSFRIEAGTYELRIGASSADIRGTTNLHVSEDGFIGTTDVSHGGSGGTSSGVDTAGNTSTNTGGSAATVTATEKPNKDNSGCHCTVTAGKRDRGATLFGLLVVTLSVLRRSRKRVLTESAARRPRAVVGKA
jgi:beta-glucosidase